jgi:RNA-directed DNA polymerase
VEQAVLIKHLNPVIRGWARYYAPVISAHGFRKLNQVLYSMLPAWAGYRHGDKSKHWTTGKYWRVDDGQEWLFQPAHSDVRLYHHPQTPIRRYVTMQGSRGPYDGDWVYWSPRLGRHPEVSSRVVRLLKSQQGKCPACGLFFTGGERLEVDHVIPAVRGARMPSLTFNSSINIVTTTRRRENIAVKVRLTNAAVLRSRVRRKSQARFCSRAGVSSLRLRQRMGQ